jgi:hypothetical protein
VGIKILLYPCAPVFHGSFKPERLPTSAAQRANEEYQQGGEFWREYSKADIETKLHEKRSETLQMI